MGQHPKFLIALLLSRLNLLLISLPELLKWNTSWPYSTTPLIILYISIKSPLILHRVHQSCQIQSWEALTVGQQASIIDQTSESSLDILWFNNDWQVTMAGNRVPCENFIKDMPFDRIRAMQLWLLPFRCQEDPYPDLRAKEILLQPVLVSQSEKR